jgi:hypothetical protein
VTGATLLTTQEATRRARADETILAVYGPSGLRLYAETDWWAAEVYADGRHILDWATGEYADYEREPVELVFVDLLDADKVKAALVQAGLEVSDVVLDLDRRLYTLNVIGGMS